MTVGTSHEPLAFLQEWVRGGTSQGKALLKRKGGKKLPICTFWNPRIQLLPEHMGDSSLFISRLTAYYATSYVGIKVDYSLLLGGKLLSAAYKVRFCELLRLQT